jgi:hypothetical protein
VGQQLHQHAFHRPQRLILGFEQQESYGFFLGLELRFEKLFFRLVLISLLLSQEGDEVSLSSS